MNNLTRMLTALILIALTVLVSIVTFSLATENNQNQVSNTPTNTNTEMGDMDEICTSEPTDLEPFASFYVTPTIPTINKPIRFLDASKAGSGNITNWSWKFGDGQTSNSVNPIHIYSNTGEKTVTLTVTNTNGKTSTSTRTFTVSENSIYETSFVEFTTTPTTIYATQPITFTEVSLTGHTQSLQWFWDFGDGTTSTDQTPTHTYSTTGEKQVTLSVIDAQLKRSIVTHTIVVHEITAPIAEFIFAPNEPTIGNTITFHCITTVGSGIVNQFLWDFGDQQTSTSHHPTHTYTTAGEKTITFTVTDTFGKTSTTTQTIYVASD